jgi:toxin ParE1/3/4
VKIIVREKAADDLDRIYSWIAQDSPRAAAALVRRIRERIGRLVTPGLEYMGRPGLVERTRELVEPPYVVVYRIDEQRDEIVVLAVFHGAQDR